MWWYSALIALLSYVIIVVIFRLLFPEKHLDWSSIDLSQTNYPDSFQWGVATAAHQIEGNNHNNWSEFENNTGIEKSGGACNHWKLWKTDFDLLEELGVSNYRFSIEWSRIQPERDTWNEEAVGVYSEMVDDLLKRGIKPVVTLHHFTHPVWFEELGGFYQKENISYWVDYCERLFGVLGDRVNDWCTVNEPEVVSIMGYQMKMFPPGKRSVLKTIRVMRNMIDAHSQVYHRLKSHSSEIRVGLAKNITLFDPLYRWNLVHWITSIVLDYVWNGAIISALSKGRMFGRKLPSAKSSVDFIGLNYYTHVLASPFLPQTTEIDLPKRSHEVMTEFGYPMYAEGLERSVKKLSKLKVPIEITENGVADSEDTLRPEHLKRHLWMVSELLKQGYDIRSYYHWSLFDNFEWAEGYKLRFGLYHVNYETQERTLRESGKLYQSIIKNS